MTPRICRLAATLALAAAVLPGTHAHAEAETLGALLAEFHDRYDFPGATAAIALPDGQIVTAATGLADVEAGTPMQPDTRMLAASIGKTVVAATVLSAVAEGRIGVDDLLSDHLGDRPWFDRLPNADTITVGHLLRHTSGLPDHVHMLALGDDPVTVAERAKYTATARDLITSADEVFFEGMIDPARLSLLDRLAVRMVRSPVGDRHDWGRIAAWARGIAPRLAVVPS